MNTGKQINAMVVVLFLLLISLGAYSVWEPFRADTKEDKQNDLTLERAGNTFALNCRLCHGDRGEGGQNGGRLPAAPALDSPRLQGISDGVFTQAEYEADFKLVSNTIMCGRVGTVMPTWGRSQGGTLSDEQIRQLAVLITTGSWDVAAEHADELDAEATQHATLKMPGGTLAADATEIVVSNAEPITLGQYLRIGEERMRVLPKQLEVQRGVNGTEAVEHARATEVLFQAGPPPELADEDPQTLSEAVDEESTTLVIADTDGFAVGDVLQLEDELVRVTGISRGIPTTNQFLAEDIGREPDEFLVSDADGIAVGDVVRLDGELLEVLEVRGDGDPGIELDLDLSSAATEISVTEPTFFREDYVVRIGDELIRFGEAVGTDQTLGDTIGRAETSFSLSGTANISEGMTVRIGDELMRVTEIVSPTTVELERGAEDTEAAPHPPDTPILRIVPPVDEDAEPTEDDTEQALLEGLNSEATSAVVTGSLRIAVDGTYRLDNEIVRVTALEPAVIRVERAVDGTERGTHARRSDIFVRSLFDVTRGFGGTTSAGHSAGDELLFTELKVDREVDASRLADHQKGDELFMGHRLIVARGLLGTDLEEHANGELVYNFPPPPDEPAPNIGEACGLVAVGDTGEEVPTPAPGAEPVSVELDEFTVVADPASGGAGPFAFNVENVGTAVHNFRVVATDLAPDALPLDSGGLQVDESQVEVMSGFTTPLDPGGQLAVGAELAAGPYVLICNVPTHYESGMYTAFQVTP